MSWQNVASTRQISGSSRLKLRFMGRFKGFNGMAIGETESHVSTGLTFQRNGMR